MAKSSLKLKQRKKEEETTWPKVESEIRKRTLRRLKTRRENLFYVSALTARRALSDVEIKAKELKNTS